MKTLFVILLTPIFLLFSCSSSEQEIEIPTGILTEEKMIDVLTHSYLSEGASGINIKNVQSQQFDSTYAFNPLKDKGISKGKFDSSVVFYSQHPRTLKIIYEKVLEKLSTIQAKGKIN